MAMDSPYGDNQISFLILSTDLMRVRAQGNGECACEAKIGQLDDVAAQKEWAGRKWPSEAWKDLFAASLMGQELVPNLDNNGFVAFHSRTSEFSPETMSDMITLIESWGASNGVTFTDTPQEANAGTGMAAPSSSPAPAASPVAGGPRAGEQGSALAPSPARFGGAP